MKKTLLLALGLSTGFASHAQWSTDSGLNTAVKDVAGTAEVTPLAAAGPAGGTWVSWFEIVPGGSYELRVQLLDRNGNKTLGANGLLVSNNPQTSSLSRYDLKSDAAGNALLAFQDTRTGALQCVVYKISPAGAQLWGAGGIQLLDPAATTGIAPTIAVLNSGNVVVAWNAGGTGRSAVAWQKFSPAGVPAWPAPRRLQDAAAHIERAVPLPSGTDEVLLYYVRRSGIGQGVSTMFAHRFDATGAAVLPAAVQVSDKTIGFAFFAQPVPDGAGGFFVAFNSGNPANANLGDVYVQRVRPDGTLWSTSGTEVITGTASARFDGHLAYVPAQNELFVALSLRNSSQSQSGISLQRLSPATGAALTPAPATGTGVEVFGISPNYYMAQALRDTGAGLIIVYTEDTSALNRLLAATRVSYAGATGTFPTGTGNVVLSGTNSAKQNYSVLPYASGQLVTVWADRRTDEGVYAQAVTDDGQLGVITAARPRLSARPLVLAPNPGLTPTLHLRLAKAQAVQVLVRDLSGRQVHQQQLVLPAGAATAVLEAPALAAGVYVVEATLDGETWRGRWLKE